jgi:hypothetical protein
MGISPTGERQTHEVFARYRKQDGWVIIYMMEDENVERAIAHPGLDIVGYDGVSDSAQEIFNFCENNGITKIVIMGVLGRPSSATHAARDWSFEHIEKYWCPTILSGDFSKVVPGSAGP